MREDPVDTTLASYASAGDKYLVASTPPGARLRVFLDQIAEVVGAGHVLELGSGPGTDADYLAGRGVRVSRTDAAPGFVRRLRNAGHDARLLDARSDDFGGPYDAVMANAVLLHLSRDQFGTALRTARHAVREHGLLAITLKDDDGAGWSTAKLDEPRHFTYWRATELDAALVANGWQPQTTEAVDGRLERWLFAIARAA